MKRAADVKFWFPSAQLCSRLASGDKPAKDILLVFIAGDRVEMPRVLLPAVKYTNVSWTQHLHMSMPVPWPGKTLRHTKQQHALGTAGGLTGRSRRALLACSAPPAQPIHQAALSQSAHQTSRRTTGTALGHVAASCVTSRHSNEAGVKVCGRAPQKYAATPPDLGVKGELVRPPSLVRVLCRLVVRLHQKPEHSPRTPNALRSPRIE